MLVAVAGVSVSLFSGAWAKASQPELPAKPPRQVAPPKAPPSGKKVVMQITDLPQRQYPLELKPSEAHQNPEVFAKLMAQVKQDIEADLREFDVQEPRIALQLYGTLANIAILEGRLDDAQANYDTMKTLEANKSVKPLMGIVMISAVKAMRDANNDPVIAGPRFKADLDNKLRALPWTVVGEQVMRDRGSAAIMTPTFIVDRIRGAMDPGWDPEVRTISSLFAMTLVGMRASENYVVPLSPIAAEVYTTLTNENEGPLPDIWTPNQVELTGQEGGSPVIVGVWDGGVDAQALGDILWTNPSEQPNGLDDDANGYIDDMHGIAFDYAWQRDANLLMPLIDVRSEPTLVQQLGPGFADERASVYSPSRTRLMLIWQRVPYENRQRFEDDLALWSMYARGTHVASVVASGNPYARIVAARVSIDPRRLPSTRPEQAIFDRAGQSIRDSMAYMRKAGVRVVQISWAIGPRDIERQLAAYEIGRNDIERVKIALPMYLAVRKGIEETIRNNPDILFIGTMDGTDQGEATMTDVVPSLFSLPNLLVVGGVNASALPVKFTTRIPTVWLYANGREVEGVVPGGDRIKLSSPAVASAQVTSLAAKLLALNPKLKPDETINLIRKGATPLPRTLAGRFFLNPKQSLDLLKQGL